MMKDDMRVVRAAVKEVEDWEVLTFSTESL